jgi:integrase
MRVNRQSKNLSVWEPTRYQNLFRYVPSGAIFARLKISGKQVRRSLKTTDPELAKRKLVELERHERAVAQDRRRGKMLFGEALEEWLKSRRCDPSLAPSTKDYDDQRAKALLQSWPGLETLDIRRIKKEDCEQWAAGFAEQYGATTYNHTISIVKHALERAVERGVIHHNPSRSLKRQAERSKKLTLPTQEQFDAFVKEIESGGSGKSKPCADLVRFLGFGGFRKMEATYVTLADLDFDSGTIRVYGHPQHGTKNDEFRSVPMVPEMRELLLRLQSERPDARPEDTVMTVRECQKAMNRAAALVGMKRITHHDLRHFFATRCIESGVDIPTVSRWLGHKDGGALAMKTYGHLRDEHSLAMAQKVFFFGAQLN